MKRVGIIGSGNWGTTIARVIAENLLNQADFEKEVKLWVLDEIVNGESLVKLINTNHENVKYLRGFPLPETLVAYPNLKDVSENSDFLVFVTPHQFLKETLEEMVGHTNPNAVGISLIKGLTIVEDKIEIITDTITKALNIKCGSLMGPNIANDIAARQYCESTLAFPDPEIGEIWLRILNCSYFSVELIRDIVGQQLCGTMKNVIALAGGLVDGLGFGQSTKAAVLRKGFIELYKFAKWAFPDRGIELETMLASCGFGDIVASSYGGRNRLCAEYFAKTGTPISECEAKLLNGQKMEGNLTAFEVYTLLKLKGAIKEFPFFATCHLITIKKVKPDQIFHVDGDHLNI